MTRYFIAAVAVLGLTIALYGWEAISSMVFPVIMGVSIALAFLGLQDVFIAGAVSGLQAVRDRLQDSIDAAKAEFQSAPPPPTAT